MAYIGKQPTIGNFQKCDAISVVNGQAAYTLQVGGSNVSPESANHCLVSLNGILQAPTDSYTISGSTLTFASNLVTGDVIDFVMILGNVLDLGVPSDNTVSLAKLTATGTKDATTFLRGDNSFQVVSSDWVKIAHTNVTSPVSSVDFVNGTGGVVIDSTYRYYKLFCTWRPSTNGAVFYVRVANGGTFRTSGYLAEVFRSYYSGGTGRANGTAMLLRGVGGTQNATEQRSNAELTFYNMSDSTLNTTAQLLSQAIDGTGNTENQVNNQIGGGVYTTAEAHNGIRIFMDSGNIEAGEFTLYGIKE
jgi:hypothetical protein